MNTTSKKQDSKELNRSSDETLKSIVNMYRDRIDEISREIRQEVTSRWEKEMNNLDEIEEVMKAYDDGLITEHQLNVALDYLKDNKDVDLSD